MTAFAKPANKTMGFGEKSPKPSPSEAQRIGKKYSTEGPASPRTTEKPPRRPNRNQTSHYTPKIHRQIGAHKMRSLMMTFSRSSPSLTITPLEHQRQRKGSKLKKKLPTPKHQGTPEHYGSNQVAADDGNHDIIVPARVGHTRTPGSEKVVARPRCP